MMLLEIVVFYLGFDFDVINKLIMYNLGMLLGMNMGLF